MDTFETAIQSAARDRGVAIAFGFGKGAYEGAARANSEVDFDTKLKTVEEILNETS